jgi:hypothetical protein
LDNDIPNKCHKLISLEEYETDRDARKQYDEFIRHVEQMQRLEKIGLEKGE